MAPEDTKEAKAKVEETVEQKVEKVEKVEAMMEAHEVEMLEVDTVPILSFHFHHMMPLEVKVVVVQISGPFIVL